jgi:hypothetical protein
MMPAVSKLRPEEEWAAQMIAAALGAEVEQHDDGSRDAMHDLDIVYDDGARAAVEVTAAADGESIELWNLMNGGGRWVEADLTGGWMVSLVPGARANRLRKELPALLRLLEESAVEEARVGTSRITSYAAAMAASLGIAHLQRSNTEFPGSIYITLDLPMERTGGFVADTGDALAPWVSHFLESEARRDVRHKLWSSGADERHAFLLLPGFAEADFGVTDLLMRDRAPLPEIPPALPREVTHVWVVSTWSSGSGMRWAPGDRWSHFDKP